MPINMIRKQKEIERTIRMGLSASQAYLLSITSRMASNELQSQQINNAKMRLSAQSSQASADYLKALNEANLLMTNYDAEGMSQTQALTYNSLTAYSPYNNQYALVNSAGQVLVSESEASIFEKSGKNLKEFLKLNGLEYGTTYFDSFKSLEVDENYPKSLREVDSATWADWYRTYSEATLEDERADYDIQSQAYKEALGNYLDVADVALEEFIENMFQREKQHGFLGQTVQPISFNEAGQLYFKPSATNAQIYENYVSMLSTIATKLTDYGNTLPIDLRDENHLRNNFIKMNEITLNAPSFTALECLDEGQSSMLRPAPSCQKTIYYTDPSQGNARAMEILQYNDDGTIKVDATGHAMYAVDEYGDRFVGEVTGVITPPANQRNNWEENFRKPELYQAANNYYDYSDIEYETYKKQVDATARITDATKFKTETEILDDLGNVTGYIYDMYVFAPDSDDLKVPVVYQSPLVRDENHMSVNECYSCGQTTTAEFCTGGSKADNSDKYEFCVIEGKSRTRYVINGWSIWVDNETGYVMEYEDKFADTYEKLGNMGYSIGDTVTYKDINGEEHTIRTSILSGQIRDYSNSHMGFIERNHNNIYYNENYTYWQFCNSITNKICNSTDPNAEEFANLTLDQFLNDPNSPVYIIDYRDPAKKYKEYGKNAMACDNIGTICADSNDVRVYTNIHISKVGTYTDDGKEYNQYRLSYDTYYPQQDTQNEEFQDLITQNYYDYIQTLKNGLSRMALMPEFKRELKDDKDGNGNVDDSNNSNDNQVDDVTKALKNSNTYNIAKAYVDECEKYFGTYFTKNSTVKAALESIICAGDLNDITDIDALLKKIQPYCDEHNLSFEQIFSEEGQALVRNCILDVMIDKYGEPKYGWIDRNDLSNNGNADAKAQWLTNLFNRMVSGYKVLEDGLASSPEWMSFAIKSGIATIEKVNDSNSWKSMDYKSCGAITEESDSQALVAKAEAEYNRAMNDIKNKEQIFDLQLRNIDTEHSVLQQEYDTIKNVMKQNIERTIITG